MSPITPEHLLSLLTSYVEETGTSVDLLLIGALALHAYGCPDRATRDIDAEIAGPLDPLLAYLTAHGIPADLTQNFSGWSVVAMPPGYRERAQDIVHRPNIRVRVLTPVDFIIAKLRRGTDIDIEDTVLVAQHCQVQAEAVRASADAAIAASPQDTALFLFRKTIDVFCQSLASASPDR